MDVTYSGAATSCPGWQDSGRGESAPPTHRSQALNQADANPGSTPVFGELAGVTDWRLTPEPVSRDATEFERDEYGVSLSELLISLIPVHSTRTVGVGSVLLHRSHEWGTHWPTI